MLTLNDVVYVKDNKKVIATVPFKRVYFAFGPNDKVKETTSNANSVDSDGKNTEIQTPVQQPVGVDVKNEKGAVIGVTSVHPAVELLDTLVQSLQTSNPGEDPYILILQAYDEANNLAQRKPIHTEHRTPKVKEISADKAESKILATMVAGKIAPDLATAKIMYDMLKGMNAAA